MIIKLDDGMPYWQVYDPQSDRKIARLKKACNKVLRWTTAAITLFLMTVAMSYVQGDTDLAYDLITKVGPGFSICILLVTVVLTVLTGKITRIKSMRDFVPLWFWHELLAPGTESDYLVNQLDWGKKLAIESILTDKHVRRTYTALSGPVSAGVNREVYELIAMTNDELRNFLDSTPYGSRFQAERERNDVLARKLLELPTS